MPAPERVVKIIENELRWAYEPGTVGLIDKPDEPRSRWTLDSVQCFENARLIPPQDVASGGFVEWVVDGELVDREEVVEGRPRNAQLIAVVSARIALGERGSRRFAYMWVRLDLAPSDAQLELIAERIETRLNSQG